MKQTTNKTIIRSILNASEKPLSVEQRKELIEALASDKVNKLWKNQSVRKRNVLILRIIVETGIRPVYLSRLRNCDLDITNKSLRITLLNGSFAKFYISESLCKSIYDYIMMSNTKPSQFDGLFISTTSSKKSIDHSFISTLVRSINDARIIEFNVSMESIRRSLLIESAKNDTNIPA